MLGVRQRDSISPFCVQALCKDFKEVSPICTMEYMPHCASNGQTYSNRCAFCNAYLYVWGEIFPFMISSCTCWECRAVSSSLFF